MTAMTLAEQIGLADRLSARHRGEESHGLAQIARTLRWLERWESVVRDAVNRRQSEIAEALADPAVAAVLEEFPDADVSVSDPEERARCTTS